MTKNKKINNSVLVDGKTVFRRETNLLTSFFNPDIFAKIEK